MISDSPTFKQGHGSPEWKAGVGWGGRGTGVPGGRGPGTGGKMCAVVTFPLFSFFFFSFTGMNDITFEAYNPLLLLCVMCLSYRCSPPTYVSRVAYGRLSYLNP